jgi:hypothetical protein
MKELEEVALRNIFKKYSKQKNDVILISNRIDRRKIRKGDMEVEVVNPSTGSPFTRLMNEIHKHYKKKGK